MNEVKKIDKKEKLTFSKIEILFMIVLLALLMTAGIAVFTLTTNRQLEGKLKKEAVHLSGIAENKFLAEDMKENSEYIVTGSDGMTRGMCITVKAINPDSKFDGYFVIEEGINKDKTVSVWLTDKKIVIDGYTSKKINELNNKEGITKYNDNDLTSKVATSFTGAYKEHGGVSETPIRYEAKCMTEKIE